MITYGKKQKRILENIRKRNIKNETKAGIKKRTGKRKKFSIYFDKKNGEKFEYEGKARWRDPCFG